MSDSFKSVSNQEGYDLWSTSYDTGPNPTVAVDELSFPKVWEHLRGKNILEIGCGTGRHTHKLAKHNQVTGIDLSAGMLEVAKKKVGPSVRLLQADILHYDGFAPGSFDAVVTSLVIEHIADLPAFFKKVGSLIKPGGECYVSELHPVKSAAGGRAYFDDPRSGETTFLVSYAHTNEFVVSSAEGAGFKIVSNQDVLGPEILASMNVEWRKYVGQPHIKIWVLKK